MSKSFDELNNMIEMLEERLEWFRARENPNDAYHHKIYRMFYTLAKCIQELKPDNHYKGRQTDGLT